MQQTDRNQPARQSLGWIWQAVTGILLIVIVLLHMIFHHFQEGLLSASGVVAHVADPAIFILEILFVLVVTYHALLGVKAVIFDLQLSDSTRQKVSMGLTVLGVITVIYGVVLAFLIRFEFSIPGNYLHTFTQIWPYVLPVKICTFFFLSSTRVCGGIRVWLT